MKNTLLFLFITLIFNSSSAQISKKEHLDVVSSFVNCIKNKNTEKLKTLVRFPLNRQYPLTDIQNEIEFIKRYQEVFDNILERKIINSNLERDWSNIGWRGIMLNNGKVWLDLEGNLIAVNYQSDEERIKIAKLIKKDKNSIHQSLNKFKRPIMLIETKKFKIRIDELENGTYRYASWSIHSTMKKKPDLIVQNGKWVPEGSGGNHRYEFNNKNYKYVCSINLLGERDSPPAKLIIYENQKEILIEPALLLKN